MRHPKLKLVNIETNEVLTYGNEEISFGGPWGWLQQDGKAVWQPNEIPLEQLKTEKITQLKSTAGSKLQATDYKAIKFAEGVLTADEFEPIKVQRQAIRDKCNELELLVAQATSKEELELIVWE